jgi:hypothetical protein
VGTAFAQRLATGSSGVAEGALALEIVAVVVLAGISITLLPDVSLAAEDILLPGCLGVLFANLTRVCRR